MNTNQLNNINAADTTTKHNSTSTNIEISETKPKPNQIKKTPANMNPKELAKILRAKEVERLGGVPKSKRINRDTSGDRGSTVDTAKALAIKMRSSQDEDPIKENLRVIITGMEHSGTTITGRLIMNAPCLIGATETGYLLAKTPKKIHSVLPWYNWNIDNGNDSGNDRKRMMYLLKEDDYRDMSAAENFSEMYKILRNRSHLFNDLNDFYDDGRECEKPTQIVDKTPRYVWPEHFENILIKTPGVPVIVVKKPFKDMRTKQTKEFYDEVYNNVDKMKKRYPNRIIILNYDEFINDPETIMECIFEFVGLTWKSEYLKMSRLKKKFSAFPDVVKQIGDWEFVPGGHSPEGPTKFH